MQEIEARCATESRYGHSNAERSAELPVLGAMLPVYGAHANAERLTCLAVLLTNERRVCGLWLLAARWRCRILTDSLPSFLCAGNCRTQSADLASTAFAAVRFNADERHSHPRKASCHT